MFSRKNCPGNHCKRNIDFLFFSVYFHRCFFMICVGKTNGYISAFSNKLFGCNLFSIQFICDCHIYRKLLIGSSLIIDIVSIRIPNHISIRIYRIRLISFYIFDVRKVGSILDYFLAFCIFQAITDNDFLCIAHSIRHYINDFILLWLFVRRTGFLCNLLHHTGQHLCIVTFCFRLCHSSLFHSGTFCCCLSACRNTAHNHGCTCQNCYHLKSKFLIQLQVFHIYHPFDFYVFVFLLPVLLHFPV